MTRKDLAPLRTRVGKVLAEGGLQGVGRKIRSHLAAETARAGLVWRGRQGAKVLRRDLPVPPDQVRRILFIKLWGLGDMVMATPALAMLKARFPEAEIILVGPPSVGRVLEGAGIFSRHLSIPWDAIHNTSPKLYRVLGQAQELRADLAVVSSPLNSPRISSVLDRLNAHWVVATEKSAAPDRVSALVPDPYERHLVEVNADLARVVGATGPTPPLQLWLNEAERQAASQWLAEHAAGKPRICFHVGSIPTMARKRWPARYFIELGDRLSAQWMVPIIILEGPDDVEAVKAVSAGLRVPPVVAGRDLTLRQTMAVVEGMDILVASNSFWAHVAAAVRTPVLSFTGPSPPSYDPWGEPARIRVLKGEVECAPCWGRGDSLTCPEPRCMDSITPEMAAVAADQLITLQGLKP